MSTKDPTMLVFSLGPVSPRRTRREPKIQVSSLPPLLPSTPVMPLFFQAIR